MNYIYIILISFCIVSYTHVNTDDVLIYKDNSKEFLELTSKFEISNINDKILIISELSNYTSECAIKFFLNNMLCECYEYCDYKRNVNKIFKKNKDIYVKYISNFVKTCNNINIILYLHELMGDNFYEYNMCDELFYKKHNFDDKYFEIIIKCSNSKKIKLIKK